METILYESCDAPPLPEVWNPRSKHGGQLWGTRENYLRKTLISPYISAWWPAMSNYGGMMEPFHFCLLHLQVPFLFKNLWVAKD
jgi:hypothetical protein